MIIHRTYLDLQVRIGKQISLYNLERLMFNCFPTTVRSGVLRLLFRNGYICKYSFEN